MCRH